MQNDIGDLTKEFKILPSPESIRELIRQDAARSAQAIQEKLLEKVVEMRGDVAVRYDTSDRHTGLIAEMMSKWAKLYGYECKYRPGHKWYLSLRGEKKKPEASVAKRLWRWYLTRMANGFANILGLSVLSAVAFYIARWIHPSLWGMVPAFIWICLTLAAVAFFALSVADFGTTYGDVKRAIQEEEETQ